MKLPNGVDRYPALEIGFRVQMYTALGVPPKPKGVPAHIFMNMTYSSEKMDFFAAVKAVQVEHIRFDPGVERHLVVNQLKVHTFFKVLVSDVCFNLHPLTPRRRSLWARASTAGKCLTAR